MPDALLPVLPIAVLLAAALLSLTPLQPPQRAPWLAPAACLLALPALSRLPAARGPLILSSWEPFELYQGGMALAPEMTGLLLAGGALAAVLASALVATSEETPLQPPALLLTGCLLAFLWSANLLTALLLWAAMDGALAWLIWRASPAHRRARRLVLALVSSVFGVLVLSMAAVLLAHLRHTTFLAVEALPLPVLLLLWLAAAVRLGLYPLHLWLPFRQRQAPLYAAVGALPFLAGTYLLVRARLAFLGPVPAAGLVSGLAALSLLVAGILAWRSRYRAGGSPLYVFHGAWVAAGGAIGSPLGPAAALWQGIFFPLGLAVWAAAERARQVELGRWGGRLARAVRLAALGSLAGLPPAAAFLSRWIPLHEAIASGRYWLLAAAALGGSLLLLSLRRELDEGPAFPLPLGAPLPASRAMAALLLVGLPFVLVGLQPLLLAGQLAYILGEQAAFSLAGLVRGVDQRIGALIMFVLLVPVLAARELGSFLHREPAVPRAEALGAHLHLDWLYRAIWRAFLGAAGALRAMTRFLEGEGFVGWVILAGIFLALILQRYGS